SASTFPEGMRNDLRYSYELREEPDRGSWRYFTRAAPGEASKQKKSGVWSPESEVRSPGSKTNRVLTPDSGLRTSDSGLFLCYTLRSTLSCSRTTNRTEL